MNGEWFWWGGRPGPGGYQALYRMTFERLVHFHRLDNLVWVWNANAPDGPKVGPYHAYYPGPEWVDILATDIYRGYAQSHHDDLVKLAAGKPVALGEIGKPPTPEELSAQPAWTWFMGWSNIFNRDFNDNHRALFANPKVRWRGDALP